MPRVAICIATLCGVRRSYVFVRSCLDAHTMIDVISPGGTVIGRVLLDSTKVDRSLAVGAIIMALFNLHFVIMHLLHAAYMLAYQGYATMIAVMHTFFNLNGHIIMQQQVRNIT